MDGRDRALLGLLVLDSVVLAIVELMYLPLRFDGFVLPQWGDAPFPVTVLLAMVTSPWLVSRASELGDSALVAGAPLWGWLATLFALALFGPGGDVVVVQDWRTLLLLACGAFPAALRLGLRGIASGGQPGKTGVVTPRKGGTRG